MAEGMPQLGRAFVIGGGSVYGQALKMAQTKSVLMTKVYGEFECDTFFPVDLDGEDGKTEGWERRSREELGKFTGEEFGDGEEKVKEGDVEFEYCLYER